MRNILFLCTGNSARSIMAEAYMNHAGAGPRPDRGWRAFSAGSKPAGAPNPFALETLRAHAVPVPGDKAAPRSKSWDEFAGSDAPIMDVVVTVCDNAAAEVCPVWPAQDGKRPSSLHWSFPDPASVEGDDAAKRAAFKTIFAAIAERIDAFLKENAA